MEHKGVEYTVVQLAGGAGWKWEVRFGDGKNKSGITPESRAFAIKLAELLLSRIEYIFPHARLRSLSC